jgi:hypothetical protein
MKILDRMGGYLSFIGQDQHRPQQKWLRDMVYGIYAGHSVMLSEIGRALREPLQIAQTEKRLSRNLNSGRLDETAIQRRVLEHASTLTRRNDGQGVVVAVDYTDIQKPYTRRRKGSMEHACVCRDGSRGDKGIGYPIVQIEACLPTGVQLPLVYHPFSFIEPGYRSQTLTFLDKIGMAAPYVGTRAWWVFDRGFDGNPYFAGLDEIGLRWICRLKVNNTESAKATDRFIQVPDGRVVRIDEAAAMIVPRLTVKKIIARGKRAVSIRIGAITVRTVEAHGKGAGKRRPWGAARTLIAAWGIRVQGAPFMLLVSEELKSGAEILDAFNAYLKRWHAEEATRSFKDSRSWGPRLEDARALTLRGMRRLALVICAVYGFMALLRVSADSVAQVALKAIMIFKAGTDCRYRLFRGISQTLQAIGRVRRARWRAAQ